MKHLLLVLAVLIAGIVNAQDKSILFLGNSYTYTSNLPQMVYELALANGDTIYHESNTPGGYTFEGHSTNNSTLTKIASRDWDFVVLQEQSQRPSFPPTQVADDVYPYAAVLVDSIKSNYECTEPVFFMTWGRRDGDQQNCQFYAPLCTFEGMNARLRESYTEMADVNDATVAPCGAAWQQMKLDNPTFWNGLYSGDGSHPSAWGTYLNACIFYATMFRESPVGLDYYASIGQADAEVLQQVAEDMVMDSLDNWFVGHQDVTSDFTYEYQGGLSVSFESNSMNATNHQWDFGSGSTSNQENPTNTYNSGGTYIVQHIASSGCGSDTSYSQFSITPFGFVSSGDENSLEEVGIWNQGQTLNVLNNLNSELTFSVFDLSGKIIWMEPIGANTQSTIDINLNKGLYLIRLDDGKHQSTRKLFLR